MIMRFFGKILAIFDIAVMLVLLFHSGVPLLWLKYGALYLIVKGGIFVLISRDIFSYVDLCCGVYILIVMFGLSFSPVTNLVIIFLGFKATIGLIF